MLQRIRNKRQGQKGFTLIELMIVIAIIGILAAIAIPNFISYRKRSYDTAAQSDLKNLMTAQEAYYVDNSTYKDFSNEGSDTASDTITLSTSPELKAYLSKGVHADADTSTSSYTMTAYHTSGSATWTVHGPGGSIGK